MLSAIKGNWRDLSRETNLDAGEKLIEVRISGAGLRPCFTADVNLELRPQE